MCVVAVEEIELSTHPIFLQNKGKYDFRFKLLTAKKLPRGQKRSKRRMGIGLVLLGEERYGCNCSHTR